VGPVTITDLDIADEIALITLQIDRIQELLTRLEKKAAKVGFHLIVKLMISNSLTNITANS